jgi:hypothetical protein
MRLNLTHLLVTGAVGVALPGCTRVAPDVGSVPQPNPQSAITVDVNERVKQMRDLTNQLLQLANQLPAPDEQSQRDAMRNAFDLSARLLPLLMGPAADGQFRLQQRIVADARDQLARDPDRLAQEPTVGAGLRSVYNALVRISQESFYTAQSITADLTELGARVDTLDTVRGPLHRDAAARAVAQAATVMDRMTRIYTARLSRRDPAPPAPNPTETPREPAGKK